MRGNNQAPITDNCITLSQPVDLQALKKCRELIDRLEDIEEKGKKRKWGNGKKEKSEPCAPANLFPFYPFNPPPQVALNLDLEDLAGLARTIELAAKRTGISVGLLPSALGALNIPGLPSD